MTRPPRSSTLESAAARYLSARRGRAAFSGPPAIGRAAGKLIKPLSARFGPGIDTLSENWTEIVGERLASWSAPEAVRGNVLFITAKGPAAAIIEAEAARILERVANFAGDRAPSRLQVRQGTLRKSDRRTPISREVKTDLHKKMEPKGADRLSSALERFDRAVCGKTETRE